QDNVLQECPEDLTAWTPIEVCDEGTVCDLATFGCIDQCPERAFRCNGTQPEECVELDDGRIAWQVVGAPCATPGLCWTTDTQAGCSPPQCGGFLPDFRCNPDDP